MKKERCLNPDEFEAVMRLAPESWERRHIESCPRCRALLTTHGEFLQDRSAPEGSDLEDAGVRLRASFREAMLRGPDPEIATRRPMSRNARARRSFHAGWTWILGPAAAAALLVFALRVGVGFLRVESGPDLLRGPQVSEEGAVPSRIEVLEPQPDRSDRLVIRWRSAPQASTYEVLLLDGNLEEFFRCGPFADTTCVIRREDLPSGISSGTVVGYQVVGYRDGDPVVTSSMGTTRLP